jgi:signal recognition particle subunit SEC65
VKSPRTAEIIEAVKKLGLKYEIPGMKTKTALWHKTGMILVEKRWSKAQTIRNIAEGIHIARQKQ